MRRCYIDAHNLNTYSINPKAAALIKAEIYLHWPHDCEEAEIM
jgi:hypothetical protein